MPQTRQILGMDLNDRPLPIRDGVIKYKGGLGENKVNVAVIGAGQTRTYVQKDYSTAKSMITVSTENDGDIELFLREVAKGSNTGVIYTNVGDPILLTNLYLTTEPEYEFGGEGAVELVFEGDPVN